MFFVFQWKTRIALSSKQVTGCWSQGKHGWAAVISEWQRTYFVQNTSTICIHAISHLLFEIYLNKHVFFLHYWEYVAINFYHSMKIMFSWFLTHLIVNCSIQTFCSSTGQATSGLPSGQDWGADQRWAKIIYELSKQCPSQFALSVSSIKLT